MTKELNVAVPHNGHNLHELDGKNAVLFNVIGWGPRAPRPNIIAARSRNVRRETTSRDLCGRVCPSHTSERGGEGDCVREGEGEEGERERERELALLLYHSPPH
jgi:hypothetical protein